MLWDNLKSRKNWFKKGNIFKPWLGKQLSRQHKESISKTACKNNVGKWMKGRRNSPKTEFKTGMISGKNHPNWQGGISKQGYSFNFDRELKDLIRQRDDYKCQLCGIPQLECLKKLSIHHIDYNKENLDPKNLIVLCNACNSKVNFNRGYWQKLFEREEKMYRHGDLIIQPVDEVRGKKVDHLILAFGEATKHKHEIIEGEAELFEEIDGTLYLKVKSEEAVLTHPEHGPIKIPKGDYSVEHQREYAPDQSYKRERRVLD